MGRARWLSAAASVLARTGDELASAVRDIIRGDLASELRSRARGLFAPPGQAAERVADEVVAIATWSATVVRPVRSHTGPRCG